MMIDFQNILFKTTIQDAKFNNLYNHISSNMIWKKNIYNRLVKISNKKIKQYKFDKAFSCYYIDTLNFPDNHDDIMDDFKHKLQRYSNLQINSINEIIRFSFMKILSDGPITIEIKYINDQQILISVGRIKQYFDKSLIEKLLYQCSPKLVINLILRYSLLDTKTGYFWSINKYVYDHIKNSSNLETIECFASPFNNNIDNYCSVFNLDSSFGSKVNFFRYIKNLNEPKQLVINPPFTELMISKSIRVSYNYFIRMRVHGAKCIFMLPYWNDLADIQFLLNNEYSNVIVMNTSEYTINNYSINNKIIAPMPVYLITLGNVDIETIYNMFNSSV